MLIYYYQRIQLWLPVMKDISQWTKHQQKPFRLTENYKKILAFNILVRCSVELGGGRGGNITSRNNAMSPRKF